MEQLLNRVTCGDCLERMKELPDKSIDLTVCDPPYNFEAMGGGFYGGKWHGKLNEPRKYLSELSKNNCTEFNPILFLQELKRVMKRFNAVFFCNKFLVKDYIAFAVENGYTYDIHVMIKTNPIPAKQNHYLHDIEYIIVIRESGATFNLNEKFDLYHKHYTTTCKPNNLHPAQKTIEIIEKYIRVLSKEKDIIFDGYAGSFTTAVAAKRLCRNFIAFEISEQYCKIGEQRLKTIPVRLDSFLLNKPAPTIKS